ncbi:hypothetical protein Tco_0486654 [Tanacetum coccineum]
MSFGNKDADEVVLICWIVARCNGNISGGLVMIVYFYPSELGCTNDGHGLVHIRIGEYRLWTSLEAYLTQVVDKWVLNVNAAIVSTASTVTTVKETQQVVARDEKWVPSADRVKISSTNLRPETIVSQKEETFQVVIDLIKNSTCFKAFTISVDVPEIFMLQFWYTIKKVQGTDSYEFLLANKKCRFDVEVFRKILDICLRVKGEEFTELQNDDDTLTFLIDLGYKRQLHKHTNMFVDHMSQPWRTLVAIINKCLSGKTASNEKLRKSRIDIMWGILKFVRIGEDYQEYGLAIPDVMLNDTIKQSESYQMFIKYSTGEIPPKKSRGKCSQGKKTVDESQETVDVSEESEPEPVKKKTASRRVVKKKVIISIANNIIPDPDVALELGKSINLTKAAEEAARQVHATHARIVTESVSKPARRRVPNESTVISATSSEGTGTKPRVPDEEKAISKEKVILEWGSKQKSEYSKEDTSDDKEKNDKDDDADDKGDDRISDIQDTNDEDAKTEPDEDEIYKYKICVRKDEDVEMTNAKVEDSKKDDAEISDVAQADVEKTKEIKDVAKKAELPPTSSSLSVSLGFGDQFLKLSSDNSLVSTVKDNTDAEINSLLEVKIQFEVPHIQSLSVLRVPVFVIFEPAILTLVQETPSVAPVTTLPSPSVSTKPLLRLSKLEKDVFELKNIDDSAKTIATLKSQVSTVVDDYLGSKLGDALQKALQKHSEDLIQKHSVKPAPDASEILKIKREQAEKQKIPKYTIKSTYKAALKEHDQKSALYQTIHENKSFNKNPANHKLYHALIEALIEDKNAMDKGGKKTKRRRIKESESSKKPPTTKESPKGKSLSKGSKTGKSASAKEPVEEPIAEVVMDDAGKDVVRDDDQPQDTSKPKTTKTPNPEWFKQPSRPPTPDPEWNKHQVVLG